MSLIQASTIHLLACAQISPISFAPHGKGSEVKETGDVYMLTCDQALFSFRSVKHSGGTGSSSREGGHDFRLSTCRLSNYR